MTVRWANEEFTLSAQVGALGVHGARLLVKNDTLDGFEATLRAYADGRLLFRGEPWRP